MTQVIYPRPPAGGARAADLDLDSAAGAPAEVTPSTDVSAPAAVSTPTEVLAPANLTAPAEKAPRPQVLMPWAISAPQSTEVTSPKASTAVPTPADSGARGELLPGGQDAPNLRNAPDAERAAQQPAHTPGISSAKLPPEEGAACIAAIRRLEVAFRMAPPTRGVTTPVVITGPVGGVTLTPHWGDAEALMDCRFAWTLAVLSPRIRAAGFNELRYSSFYSYRNVAGSRRLSRHALGMAVDIHEMRGPEGMRAHVKRDWERTGGAANACQGPFPPNPGGRLRQMVCDLEASGLIYLVLTPDSDQAHHNHFHISGLRPGDRALTGRVAGVKVR